MEFIQELKVPQDRIAVLIGKKGFVKRHLQSRLNVKITIDSDTGLVIISGEDNLRVYEAKNIIQAIARGFNPEIAMTLLNEENCYEIIDISKYSGNSKNNLIRLRSRVIGTQGRARKYIEQITHTYICVYGKTVCIIGAVQDAMIAKKAIENLLRGSKHANVYAWIERQTSKDL